jgi:hypothetical protein
MRVAPFHEEGYAFTWSPATKKVHRNGGLVASDCYNMDAARKAARRYIAQVRADYERRRNYGA